MIGWKNSYEYHYIHSIIRSSYHSIIYLRVVKFVLLSLGSNMGNARLNLEIAMIHLAAMPETELTSKSSVYTTAPWGKTDQPDFSNACVLLKTDLKVAQLMQNILNIEQLMGRVRAERWGPRLIDIDIILFGDEIVNSPEVTVPHPYMHERRFVLEPAAEIAPEMIHPVLVQSIAVLLAKCNENQLATPSA
jgi:2-amino-4-hydroxy-6-hydroxymethyldihydropteridine diphosphokinase